VSNELLSTRQVANTFQVSVSSVSRWVRDGLLPAVRTPGGRIRVRRADVEVFLAEHGDAA